MNDCMLCNPIGNMSFEALKDFDADAAQKKKRKSRRRRKKNNKAISDTEPNNKAAPALTPETAHITSRPETRDYFVSKISKTYITSNKNLRDRAKQEKDCMNNNFSTSAHDAMVGASHDLQLPCYYDGFLKICLVDFPHTFSFFLVGMFCSC